MSLCWFANHDYSSQNRSYVLRFLNADSVMPNHLYLQYSIKILVKTVWKRSSTFDWTWIQFSLEKKNANFKLNHPAQENWSLTNQRTWSDFFNTFNWTSLEDFTWTTVTYKCICIHKNSSFISNCRKFYRIF